jgi:hypothetical protein
MAKALQAAERELRDLLDANELTKAVKLRVSASQIYLGREELPGPFSEGEIDESLRLTSLGGGQFGLSVKRHTGRWEKTPHSGTLPELVEVICTSMQHLIAPW